MEGERDATRWQAIESIFQTALQHPTDERERAVKEACASDPSLEREVASLLSHAAGDDAAPSWPAAAALELIVQPAALEPGQRIGPYEIVSFIASGGMGAVYRARDPRMGRDVAIKISAEQFSDRFTREVRAVAALNHPNICTLHDVGPNYLVMELVEGETLADRLRQRGAMPVDEALAVVRQIAAGLEAAHERGVIHRDLKPGNIKLRPDGSVKVLDFGLAKMDATSVARASNDAAGTSSLTMIPSTAGMILGTAAYMSPEQARGTPVDQRTDIWAFGVVLFEMLSGRRMFDGDTPTDVIAAVITKEPDWSALSPAVPRQVRGLIELCVRRDPRQRLRDIGDARLLIERYLAEPADPDVADRRSLAETTPARSVLWLAASAVGLVAAILGVLWLRAPIEEQSLVSLSALPPEGATFFAANPPAVSPDGRRVAFVADRDRQRLLFVRELDSSTPRLIEGAEGAGLPFWSPDGRFIAFFAGGKLKRVDGTGAGAAISLCDADQLRGGSWGTSDVIVFGTGNGGLYRVPAAGGPCTAATTLDAEKSEVRHGFPWFLPDGQHFLFTAISAEPAETRIYVGELGSERRTAVVTAFSNSVFVEPGYLLYVRDGTLVAQRFDTARHAVIGDAVPVAEGLDFGAGRGQPRYRFSAADSGVLAYIPGRIAGNSQITWYDRSGNVLATMGAPAEAGLGYGVLSPDGRTVAFTRNDPQRPLATDIWLHDLVRGVETRLTSNGQANGVPVWSPDGRFVVFNSGWPPGPFALVRQPVGGASLPEVLRPITGRPSDWSRDGRFIVLEGIGEQTGNDLWVFPLFGDQKPYPYLETRFNELWASLSPSGRWLAYSSDETSRSEVYVDSFPDRGHKLKVSIEGGDRPVWSFAGDELFFIGGNQTMMAAAIREVGGALDVGVPRALFEVPIRMGVSINNSWFDVSRDGRFLVPTVDDEAGEGPMTVILNWTMLLRK